MKIEEILNPKRILVVIEAPESLTEATRATVGRFTARRDPPHFQGDEYHAHASVPGGYEVAWTLSGARRHESKFPAQIPNDARQAVAKVLGVNPDLLESFRCRDVVLNEEVFLLVLKRP